MRPLQIPRQPHLLLINTEPARRLLHQILILRLLALALVFQFGDVLGIDVMI